MSQSYILTLYLEIYGSLSRTGVRTVHGSQNDSSLTRKFAELFGNHKTSNRTKIASESGSLCYAEGYRFHGHGSQSAAKANS
ncbi:hypothetical protein ACE6H2_023084 [Prunus campanulata]